MRGDFDETEGETLSIAELDDMLPGFRVSLPYLLASVVYLCVALKISSVFAPAFFYKTVNFKYHEKIETESTDRIPAK